MTDAVAATKPTRSRRDKPVTRFGVVKSNKGEKTIRVAFTFNVKHKKYGKIIRRTTTLHAHDEHNEANEGDTVEVCACRPLSKLKCWRLTRVLKRAPQLTTAR